MPVVRRPFGLFVPRFSGPGGRQVKKRVPVNPFDLRLLQQLDRALHAKILNFLRAKGGAPNLGHPNRLAGNLGGFGDAVRPLVDVPMVPVQRKAVNAYRNSSARYYSDRSTKLQLRPRKDLRPAGSAGRKTWFVAEAASDVPRSRAAPTLNCGVHTFELSRSSSPAPVNLESFIPCRLCRMIG